MIGDELTPEMVAMAERMLRDLPPNEALSTSAIRPLINCLLAEYDRLRLVEQAATAFVQYEGGGGTRDAVWVSRKMKLYDALAAAVRTETP